MCSALEGKYESLDLEYTNQKHQVPSKSSEFASPEVIIGLTVMAYRHAGLRPADTAKLATRLKQEYSLQKGPPRERPSYIAFEAWLDCAKQLGRWGPSGNEPPAGDLGVEDGEDAAQFETPPPQLDRLQIKDGEHLSAVHGALGALPDVVVRYMRDAFAKTMVHQHMKLTSSGVDLGGEMLFSTRLGFSGTPSNLLPFELRDCQFEPGSEAQIQTTLTSPDLCDVAVLAEWSVLDLMGFVATQGPFNALVDTGALVTGFSNEECARWLLEHGLKHCDAAVFLNSRDEKMVVDRTRAPPYSLNRCGVAKDRRFT